MKTILAALAVLTTTSTAWAGIQCAVAPEVVAFENLNGDLGPEFVPCSSVLDAVYVTPNAVRIEAGGTTWVVEHETAYARVGVVMYDVPTCDPDQKLYITIREYSLTRLAGQEGEDFWEAMPEDLTEGSTFRSRLGEGSAVAGLLEHDGSYARAQDTLISDDPLGGL